METVGATSVKDNYDFLDPTQDKTKRMRMFGIDPDERLSSLLTDLNLRSYLNQQFADFFGLPYVSAAGRVPFRRFLYDRAVNVQHALVTLGVVEDRYSELAANVQLRLPVLLAVTLRGCRRPDDLWPRIADLRVRASRFRDHRRELDAALARQDLAEAARVARALQTTADSVLSVAADCVSGAAGVFVDQISTGEPPTVETAVMATVAAAKPILKSSFI
jgi:hypothetical protein